MALGSGKARPLEECILRRIEGKSKDEEKRKREESLPTSERCIPIRGETRTHQEIQHRRREKSA